MFTLTIPGLIDVINAKTPESLSIRSLLYAMVPNAQFGYPETSNGEFETESDYNALVWLDERTKPSWEQLNAQRNTVHQKELALDLDQLRQMRYQESTLQAAGYSFKVSPLEIALVDSQLKLAQKYEHSVVNLLTADKQCVNFSIDVAENILDEMRFCLNRWVVNPLID